MNDYTSTGGNYFSAGSCSAHGFTGIICQCGNMFYATAHYKTHKRMCKTGIHEIKELWKNGVIVEEKL